MSFEKMFPNASIPLQSLYNHYKSIKSIVKSKNDVSGITEAIDYLLKIIGGLQSGAISNWKSLQDRYSNSSSVIKSLEDWAELLGLQGTNTYSSKSRSTFENIKKELVKLDKNTNKENIIKQYKSPENYRDKVLVPLCNSAKKAFGEYTQLKNKELQAFLKQHSGIFTNVGSMYQLLTLLTMVYSSTHDDPSKFGKHYDKAFGGGFLGLIFTKATDIVFDMFGMYRDPSIQPIKRNFKISIDENVINDYERPTK